MAVIGSNEGYSYQHLLQTNYKALSFSHILIARPSIGVQHPQFPPESTHVGISITTIVPVHEYIYIIFLKNGKERVSALIYLLLCTIFWKCCLQHLWWWNSSAVMNFQVKDVHCFLLLTCVQNAICIFTVLMMLKQQHSCNWYRLYSHSWNDFLSQKSTRSSTSGVNLPCITGKRQNKSHLNRDVNLYVLGQMMHVHITLSSLNASTLIKLSW